MSLVRAHLWISGRVQGVFYRVSTGEKGNELGLTGWVRNLVDGRVEAVAEGEENDVRSLIDWCHVGSPMARVDHVEVQWGEVRDDLKPFAPRF